MPMCLAKTRGRQRTESLLWATNAEGCSFRTAGKEGNILDFELETALNGQLILDSEYSRCIPTTERVLPDEAATTDA